MRLSSQCALMLAAVLLLDCSDDSAATTAAAGAGGTTSSSSSSSAGGTTSSAGGDRGLPETFTVEGVVIDDNGAPVADALVMQGGKPETAVLSDASGAFSLLVHYEGYVPAVIAAKETYRAHGAEIFGEPEGPLTLTLGIAAGEDNLAYEYQDPGDGIDTSHEDCTHCHQGFVQDFLSSKHAVAASDPLLQDLYAGVSAAYTDAASCTAAGGEWKQGQQPGSATTALDKCYLGGGVLPDLNAACGGPGQTACDDPTIAPADAPSAFGACADCHAPGIDGVAGGRNLHEAEGLSYEKGVHCDFCHKVKDVDLTLPPGAGQRLIIHRPNEPGSNMFLWEPLYYGPIPDVPNIVMGGSYQPKFDQALFCAGCHQQNQPALVAGDTLDPQRWPNGLPVHSTYEEWQAGPYNTPETPCQHCHMPAQFDRVNAVDLATIANQSLTFGFPRAPEDVRSHIFRSPLQSSTQPDSTRLIDEALYVSLSLSAQSGELTAGINLTNVGCGHAIPTGEPMRSLLLLVEVSGDGSCPTPTPSGGMTLNDTGGALAEGTEGNEISTAANTMSWPQGALLASPGMQVRVVRPTGSYDDYQAPVGLFETLPAAEKGMAIMTPVASATVQSVAPGTLTLDQPLSLQAGDVVYLGDAMPSPPIDGADALNLAGAPGYSFARVLLDSAGTRHVPHYKAVDIASDNRIPPGKHAATSHQFTVAPQCTAATVRATVLYRPIPTAMATLRGWEAKDYVIATAEQTLSLP